MRERIEGPGREIEVRRTAVSLRMAQRTGSG
jgi:hypothetical protein